MIGETYNYCLWSIGVVAYYMQLRSEIQRPPGFDAVQVRRCCESACRSEKGSTRADK
jgi:hypothetical protein